MGAELKDFILKAQKKFPLVCICIPTYNSASTIKEMLTSVLSQTYENLIVHVLDNASTDETIKIIKNFDDFRLRIHAHDQNIGAEGNFNRCIQCAEGDYTAIFHADDIYDLTMIERQIECFEMHSNFGVVFTAANKINSEGISSGLIGLSPGSNAKINVYDFETLFKIILKKGNFIITPSAMVRTKIYKDEIIEWRGNLFKSSADLDVWLRISKRHSVAFIVEPLMRYRVDQKQFSNSVRNRTSRADIFLVIDYYLRSPEINELLTEADQINLHQLIVNDRLWRAINNFSKNELTVSKMLIKEAFRLESFRGIFMSPRGLVMFITCIVLYAMIIMRLKRLGSEAIRILRDFLNK
jgi:glycosyltransferase involved in cell wall biosynthesis